MAKQSFKHYFSHNPTVNTQRTMFDMSKTDTVTLNPDYYYPNFKQLILPGDTVVLDYSNFIRMLDPLQVPMMDNLYCDTHYWFVPFDNVWDYTKQFFGEKKRPSDATISSLPVIRFTSSTLPQVGSVYDYFGIPIVGNDYKDSGGNWQPLLTGGFDVQALPLLSYYAIHDDWIMDEQRGSYLLDTPDFTKQTFAPTDFDLYKRGKRFDYFTSTILEPNMPTTTLPLGTTAPVVGNGYGIGLSGTTPGSTGVMYQWYNSSASGDKHSLEIGSVDSTLTTPPLNWKVGSVSSYGEFNTNNTPIGVTTKSGMSGMITDLSSASAVTVEALRRAFQVQAYQI